jgi:hypothetical protein
MITATQMMEMLDRNHTHYVSLEWKCGNKVSVTQIYFLETNPYGETVIRLWFFGGVDSRAHQTSSSVAEKGELDLLAWYANDHEDYDDCPCCDVVWH